MPVVRIPTVLRKHTGGEPKVAVAGGTVREAFTALVGQYPDLEENLFDDGQVRGFINVYVEDEDIRYVQGLDTAVDEDDEIAIMPAVAGGAEPEASTHGADGSAGGA